MQKYPYLWFFFLLLGCDAQEITSDNLNYDAQLAQELAADDYGMKAYFLVMLKTPDTEPEDPVLRSESFAGHMENMGKLVEDGKLVVSGPLGGNDRGYRGLFIFHNVSDRDALNSLLMTDPAIKNGFLDYEVYDWYGSAALPLYLEPSDKIWRLKP
jgi:uncharacterized protein YciI